MTQPRVSVLMPVHNGQSLLKDCLASIQAQQFTDFEAVVVDDGSTDETWAQLCHAAELDARIHPIHSAHGGIVNALNLGLAACQGEFIARMDVDDRMHPKRLAAQWNFMQANPDCGLCGCWVEPFGIDKSLTTGGRGYHNWLNTLTTNEDIKAEIFVDSPIAHSTFFVRRHVFNALGGYHDPPWAEDYDFLHRANLAGIFFGNIPEKLLRRGDRLNRLTRTDGRYRRKAMFKAKAHYFAQGDWLQEKRGVLIAGTGPSGRILADCFRAENIPVVGFVDNHAGPPDRTVKNIVAYGFDGPPPVEFIKDFRDTFIALCIGEPVGRFTMGNILSEASLSPGYDYMRFI